MSFHKTFQRRSSLPRLAVASWIMKRSRSMLWLVCVTGTLGKA